MSIPPPIVSSKALLDTEPAVLALTLPRRMLRPYFMYRSELLGDLVRLAYETINELLSEAAGDHKARPGVVAVPQTFGSVLNVHPHAHCLASRGLWDEKGQWLPVPYIDTKVAEKLFAHKIFPLLESQDLLSDERIELLRSFRNSGFSVDTSVQTHISTLGRDWRCELKEVRFLSAVVVVVVFAAMGTAAGMGAGGELLTIEDFQASELVPFALQHTPGGQNWQGALVKVHLFDATEIDGGTVTLTVTGPGAGTAILGLTGLATSVSHFLSITNGVQSGINPLDVNVNVNVVASLHPRWVCWDVDCSAVWLDTAFVGGVCVENRIG